MRQVVKQVASSAPRAEDEMSPLAARLLRALRQNPELLAEMRDLLNEEL